MIGRRVLLASIACLTASLIGPHLALAAGGGPAMPSGGGSMPAQQPLTPEEQATDVYNQGVRGVDKADEWQADALRQADSRKQEKLRAKSAKAYEAARRKFARATELRPGMYEAWNYLGYCERKLGKFDAALAAYDRALSLKPNYPEAIEYRGHAYLALGRLAEAKTAYLTLFGSNRPLAATLLTAMQQWASEHVDNTEFAAWVRERGQIAGQTAGLSREVSTTAARQWR